MRCLPILFLCLIALSSSLENDAYEQMIKEPCRRQTSEGVENYITKPLEYVDNLPEQWRWDNVNGTNFLTIVKNQHLPQYWGSCWAQAAASSMSDRIKIARKGAWPDINIAPQVFISCSKKDLGCHGGIALTAYAYAHNEYVTDETCSIYKGRGYDNGQECSPVTTI